MKKILILFLIALYIVILASCGGKHETDSKEIAEEHNEAKLDDTKLENDAEFAVEAADGGLMEVQLGQLAQAKAVSPEVKKLADMMVEDHSKANEELKALAASKNISLPATLSEKMQDEFKKISEKTGEDFDKAYTDFMVDDHKKVIRKFEDEADHGKDPELKSWASGKLAALRHHLEMSEAACKSVK